MSLGPSIWLIFRALPSLEHKLISANQFLNYKHAQKHPPIFQIKQEQRLGSFLPQKPQVSLTSSVQRSYFSSCQGKDLLLILSTCTACSKKNKPCYCNQGHLCAYSLDVPAIGTYLLRLACFYPQLFSLLLKQLFYFSGVIKRLFFRLLREIYHLHLPVISTFQLNNRQFVLLL